MKHLFNKLSAFIVMLMCVSATVQATIVHHEVCEPTLSSRGFTQECWEDTETGKIFSDAGCTRELVNKELAEAVLYSKLPTSPIESYSNFTCEEQYVTDNYSFPWAITTTYGGDLEKTCTVEYKIKEENVSDARFLWHISNNFTFALLELTVNGSSVLRYTNTMVDAGFRVTVIPNVKTGDVIKFTVKNDAGLSQTTLVTASLEYTFDCEHEYPVGSDICSKCGYKYDKVREYIHHTQCDASLSSRGFTCECWEDMMTGKIYADEAHTQELKDEALAKTVVYAKLPVTPISSISEFSQSEHENDWGVDFNWAAVTTFQDARTNTYTTPRYAEFTATGEDVSNARLVWNRSHGDIVNGKYTVKIYVNDTEKFSVDQNNGKNVEGVFVQTLPGLKQGDVVKFEVTPNAKATYSGDDPDPTFKACLEYTTGECSHEYPDGSAICSKCGNVKEHDHSYVNHECTLCGVGEEGFMIGYVGANADRKNIKWVLDESTNILTFTGTGAMEAFSLSHNAWRNEHKTTVTKVVIGEGITTIGDGAYPNGYFIEMSGLTEVSLPSTLQTIGSAGFQDCINLTSITLPEGLETIKTNSIRNCKKVTSITIPSTLTSIGSEAFADCSGLRDLYMAGSDEIATASNAFNYVTTRNITLHVISAAMYDWAKTTSPWNGFNIPRPCNIAYTDAEGENHEMNFDTEASDNIWTLTDGCTSLTIYEDIPMQQLTYTRNFSAANTWQALYVPFEMEYCDWSDKFDVAAITNFHEYTDENGVTKDINLEVRLVKNGKLLANIPYLIRAKAAGEQSIVLNDVTLKSTEVKSIGCSSTERRYTFTGTYDAISQLQTKDYIFVSGGRLCKANNDTDVLKPMRWYLTIEDYFSVTGNAAPALAKPMTIHVIGENDETTGIEEVTVVSSPIETAASGIYSLTGAKLAKPQQGINIINGNKVVVK